MIYMKIKVCGNKHNVKEVLSLRPDYMGFILYEKSPRFVNIEELEEIFKYDFQNTQAVAVSVNKDIDELSALLSRFNFKLVQLHGSENADYCKDLKKRFPEIEIIKALAVESEQIPDFSNYQETVDYLLLDTASANFGGSGQSFDWKILADFYSPKPFFLAGGINPDNIESALAINNENLCALDLNSGFEESFGRKDIQSLERFLTR